MTLMPRNIDPKRYEILTQMEKRYAPIVATIHDIKSGMSETAACKKNHIDKQLFRIYINKTKITNAENHIITVNEKTEAFLSPYEKLYQDVFNKRLTYDEIITLPYDFNLTMKKVLRTLPKKEKQAICMRYMNNWTYEEIKKHMDASSIEHIRQVIERGLRRLRESKNALRLQFGDRYIHELQRDRKTELQRKINQLNLQFEKQLKEQADIMLSQYSKNTIFSEPYNDLSVTGLITTIRAKLIHEYPDYDKHQITYLLNQLICDVNANNLMIIKSNASGIITIEDIPELSLRSQNALHRNGIYYISDLQKLTLKKLKKYQGVGKTSLTEIVTVMQKYGINIT